MNTFDHKFIEKINTSCNCFRLSYNLIDEFWLIPPNNNLIQSNCWIKSIKNEIKNTEKPTIFWIPFYGHTGFKILNMLNTNNTVNNMKLNLNYTSDYIKLIEKLLDSHVKNDGKYENNGITYLNNVFIKGLSSCSFQEKIEEGKIIFLPSFTFNLFSGSFKKQLKKLYEVEFI